MSAADLTELSTLIDWLRRDCRAAQSAAFRRSALDRLRARVPFDRAIWADATVIDRMNLREPELYGIDRNRQIDYERAAWADPRLLKVLGSPGQALAYSVDPDDPAEYLSLVSAIDVGHIVSIAHHDPIMGVASGLVLFARPDAPAFEEDHRAFVQAAFPHLRAAWIDCQVSELIRRTRTEADRQIHSAAAQGPLLIAADADFVELIRREWPSWTGPRLPLQLLDPLTGMVMERYRGRRIVARARLAIDAALVTLRERCPADDLTPRELQVAELCALGMTYREIAGRLGIAASTARNHIAAVHQRLGVKRKTEIAGILASLDRI
jgi:DNA-binding CsgD family transcriptional regulator